MKSTGVNCGGINLRGKRTKLLACQCCVAEDLRPKVRDTQHRKELLDAKKFGEMAESGLSR